MSGHEPTQVPQTYQLPLSSEANLRRRNYAQQLLPERIILVGNLAKGLPLDGLAGRRLAALANLDAATFVGRFERYNLAALGGGRKGRDLQLWVYTRLSSVWRQRRLVLLGSVVAQAFGLERGDYKPFVPTEVDPLIETVVVPPIRENGLDWWADPGHLQAARMFVHRLNIGYFIPTRGRGKTTVRGPQERFLPEQVEAAIVAGEGIPHQAAQLLSEITGLACNRATVKGYLERYPHLSELARRCRDEVGDVAELNIVREIRDGNADLSLKLLRSQYYHERGYAMMVEGRMRHDGGIEHRHAHVHALAQRAPIDISGYSTDQLLSIEEHVRSISGQSKADLPAADLAGDRQASTVDRGGMGDLGSALSEPEGEE